MGHAPGRGHGAHVDEQLDVVLLEEGDELVERPGRVPDRQDYGVRCDGSTAGTSTRRICVCPFWVIVPVKRMAGS